MATKHRNQNKVFGINQSLNKKKKKERKLTYWGKKNNEMKKICFYQTVKVQMFVFAKCISTHTLLLSFHNLLLSQSSSTLFPILQRTLSLVSYRIKKQQVRKNFFEEAKKKKRKRIHKIDKIVEHLFSVIANDKKLQVLLLQ